MADIKIIDRGCDDDDDCKRGKRGHRGPPGSASGGLLKFSGAVNSDPAQTVVNYLADTNVNSVLLSPFPASYPVAVTHSLRNLATNLLFQVPQGEGPIVIQLLKNGIPVLGFTITYGPGESGVKAVLAGPEVFVGGPPTPDVFDLQVTTTNITSVGSAVNLSATVGVE